jgi:hypothetical protein
MKVSIPIDWEEPGGRIRYEYATAQCRNRDVPESRQGPITKRYKIVNLRVVSKTKWMLDYTTWAKTAIECLNFESMDE